jgi:glyoxylase-like metal-dependent hydrolase (beta-lactamase superfamily II)
MKSHEPTVTDVALGVKQVSVGAPFRSHVYLIDGPDGPIAFDAGLKDTGSAILAAAGGRLDRVILSLAHVDHRGVQASSSSAATPRPSPTATGRWT